MYKTPVIVTDYYARKPPRCCHTCEAFINETATCTHYNQVVPEEFAAEADRCAEWYERIPF